MIPRHSTRQAGRPFFAPARATRNSIGDAVSLPVALEAVKQEAFKNSASYSPSDLDALAAVAADFWDTNPSPVLLSLSVEHMLPYASSAIACFEANGKKLPLPATGYTLPDGKGGCAATILAQPPSDPLEAACQLLGGTYTKDAVPPCALAGQPPPPSLDAKSACELLKGTYTPGATPPCALPGSPPPAATPPISSGSGMLTGLLVAGVAIGIVALTLNANKKGSRK